jgi:hypothetical protein
MNIFRSVTSLAVLLAATASSQAQYVFPAPYGPPVYAPPVYAAPRPIVNYSYYAPPAPVYAPPVTSYYAAPVPSYYAAPAVSYYAPAPVVGGAYVTRSYTGYGIFRPRGTYTESYYTPYPR